MNRWIAVGAAVAAMVSAGTPAGAADRNTFYKLLDGTWLGSLDYRDYTSDQRVKLPTLLTVTSAAGGEQFAYVYDDGNGKIVRDRELVAIDPAFAKYTVYDDPAKPGDEYKVSSVTGFDGSAGGEIVLLGGGTENGKPVDVRETIDVTAKTFVLLRETRPAGSPDFAFRHRYAFSRVPAPPA